MDNLCHTLAGMALGEAGLKRKTPLATATLVVGANLPDLDMISYAWGPVSALGFRRGWTHGVLAMAVLPLVLAGVMMAIGAWRRESRGSEGNQGSGGPRSPVPRTRFTGLLLLSALSVWSHPLLDLLNTYGVRLLMPFSGRWFYGDTLFIVDVWVWAALGTGILWSRWRARRRDMEAPGLPGSARPARIAIAATLTYMAAMAISSRLIRSELERTVSLHRSVPSRIMVAPVPLNPFRRQVVLELPESYATGSVRAVGARLEGQWVRLPRHDGLPASRAAAAAPSGRTFLTWARFPFFEVGDDCPAAHVCIRDARYFPQTWAEVAVPVGGAVSLASPLPPGTEP